MSVTLAPQVLILPTDDGIEGIPSETAPWRDVYDFDTLVRSSGLYRAPARARTANEPELTD